MQINATLDPRVSPRNTGVQANTTTKDTEVEFSDTELLLRAGSGDAAAFEEIHTRFKNFVRDVVQRTIGGGPEVEDVCQNAFLAVWLQAWRFDPARSKPPTWVAMVTRSVARDAYRARARSSRSSGIGDLDIAMPIRSTSPLEIAEMFGKARRILAEIPDRQRSVLLLACARGLTRSQIAALEGMPVGTVKTMIRRGAERMRNAVLATPGGRSKRGLPIRCGGGTAGAADSAAGRRSETAVLHRPWRRSA